MQSIALDFNQLRGVCIFTVLQKIKSKRGENPAFFFGLMKENVIFDYYI